MKAIIKLTRITEYCATVEMTEEEFQKYTDRLDGSRAEVAKAEKELNSKIKADDWMDDELDNFDSLERCPEDEQPATKAAA